MPPDFFSSREDAMLVWLVALLAFALSKDFREVGGSLVAVVLSVMHPKLLSLFGLAFLYSAGIVYIASQLGLWHPPALKATAYWFLGTAVVLAGAAVTDGARDTRTLAGTVLRRVVAVTIAVEFIVNVYALPLAVELVLTLMLLVFVGMQVVAQHDTSTTPAARIVVDAVLAVVGLVYLVHFVLSVVDNPDGFFTRATAEDFLVGPALTIALVPYLLAVAWWSRREQRTIRTRVNDSLNVPS